MMLLEYFTDPVLRAPTIGCMLMCFAAGIVGVIVFLRKESLLGEALSHSTYPGVIFGVVAIAALPMIEVGEGLLSFGILFGAFVTAFLGLALIRLLKRHLRVPSDSALCFVLSVFFGVGLTLASRVQFTHTLLYQQIQGYLYGQAATMTDTYIYIYAGLSLAVFILIALTYKEIQVMTLDRTYAKSLGIQVRLIDFCVVTMIVLAVVIGIRSVGVVLISAMLIAPPAAARQFTNHLLGMFILSGFFGLISGFFGNVLSVELSYLLAGSKGTLSLPTGPMIVLVASTLCLLALLFAPERGLIVRMGRIYSYRYRRLCENILKGLWYYPKGEAVPMDTIKKNLNFSVFYLKIACNRLIRSGWVLATNEGYSLTDDGRHRAAHIVRLHRLWEVYLVDYLGIGAERVHCEAEEMEHIITPTLEKELTELLKDPKRDPHQQLIPPKREVSGY